MRDNFYDIEIKEQMATMMEVMMSMKRIMQVNAVAVAAISTIIEVDPAPPSGLNQISHSTSGVRGKELASTGGPHCVQI